jgi:hypothetical protein
MLYPFGRFGRPPVQPCVELLGNCRHNGSIVAINGYAVNFGFGVSGGELSEFVSRDFGALP